MLRFDAADLPTVQRTIEGYLKAPATRVARVGVQEYTNEATGKKERELRLPSEVFASASMETLDGKPVVHEHHGYIDAKNARDFSRGVVTKPRQDGDYLVADVVIHDAKLIDDVERGDSELSLGYWTKREPIPGGVFKQDGSPFNGVQAEFLQTRIINNHLACTKRGRANDGTSDRSVRLRLDSAGNQIVADDPPKGSTVEITIEGKKYDVPDDAAKAIGEVATTAQKAVNDAKAAQETAEKQMKEATARADAAEAKLKEKKDAGDQSAKEAARFALLKQAEDVLKQDVSELAKKSDRDLRIEILKSQRPELKLDGSESDDFIRGVMLDAVTRTDTSADLSRVIAGTEPKPGEKRTVLKEDASKDESPLAARYKKREENRNLHLKKGA